ncbi:MAG TPA: glycosyltransferase family 2 protein [Caulobacteraceae bacterium]|nr:glycosyltransferase family 2 protein [Caulobacteraceae bacterium]
MLDGAEVPIIIIGYRTPGDISDCLASLTRLKRPPSFAVTICENGGPAAFEALVDALVAPGGPCAETPAGATGDIAPNADIFRRLRRLRLGGDGPVVIVGEARENLGYAGGINACLRFLADTPGWVGAWVLNPDTQPEPDALTELVAYADLNGKGMVGSRLMYWDNPDIVRTRGLRWRRLAASPVGVDNYAPVLPPPDPADVEARIDSPSGASFYITRACLDRIGLMDERYFLYFEDLDWGLRAKASCGIGYAYNSVVPHIGGRSIGSAPARAARSRLSVYLDFRNRLIFVRHHYSGWFLWTVAVSLLRAFEYLLVGAVGNFRIALRGTLAGLRGETGRPDAIMAMTVDARTPS